MLPPLAAGHPAPVSPSPAWTNVSASVGTPPSAREGASMVYDAADHEVVLFGGLMWSGAQSDTWVFKGGTWTNITTTAGGPPPPRYRAGMTYDAADGYVLLFGGLGGGGTTYLSDTWKFQGGAWTHLSPATSPSPREDISLAYDTADSYVLLFSGELAGPSYPGDTWTFKAGAWTNVTASAGAAPSPRESYGLANDPVLHVVLLFGGKGLNGDQGDTWEFSSGHWTNVTGSVGPAPSSREFTRMTYDALDGYTLLFGGFHWPNYLGDTWEFSGGGWVSLSPSPAPSGRYNEALTYDAGDSYTLLAGGRSATGFQGDAWNWSYPIPPPVLAASASPLSGLVPLTVTFTASGSGGLPPYGFAWAFGDGATSRAANPVHTYNTTNTFTATVTLTDSRGASVSKSFSITVAAPLAVSASGRPTSGFVPLRVNFTSTVSGGSAPYVYAWSYGDGSPPSSAASPSHVYNASGTFTATLSVRDAMGRSGTSSISVTATARGAWKLQVTASATPTSGSAPLSVAFTGGASGGTPPYTYLWSFGDGGTNSTASTSHTYRAAGSYPANLTATDAKGLMGSYVVTVTATNSTALAASAYANRTSGPVRLWVGFTGSFSGGAAPYVLSWDFGDGGTSSLASPSHNYTTVGTFVATFSVEDSAGTVARSSLTEHALAAPLSTPLQGPSTLSPGTAGTFWANASGGAPPYRYSWAFGDGATEYTAGLGMASHAWGNASSYTVEVTVTDSDGAVASATHQVNVTSSAPSSSGLGQTVIDWLLFALLLALVVATALVVVLLYLKKKGRADAEAGAVGGATAVEEATAAPAPILPPTDAPESEPPPSSDDIAPGPPPG